MLTDLNEYGDMFLVLPNILFGYTVNSNCVFSVTDTCWEHMAQMTDLVGQQYQDLISCIIEQTIWINGFDRC